MKQSQASRPRRTIEHKELDLRVCIIVPVNAPKLSKQRLTSILGPRQRETLTLLMFQQVAKAAVGAKNVDEVYVTSPSTEVCAIARRMGAVAQLEKGRRNLNVALRTMLTKLEKKNPRATALIMHADLPLVRPRDVESFAKLAVRCPIAVVPSKDGHGTNAIALTPPMALKPKFGPHSLQHHLRSAKKANLTVVTYQNPRIRFDVDEPQDVRSLVRMSRASPKLAARILEILARPGNSLVTNPR